MLLATVSTEVIRAWAIPAASQDAVVGDVAEHSWMLAMWERLAEHLDRVWPDIDPGRSLYLARCGLNLAGTPGMERRRRTCPGSAALGRRIRHPGLSGNQLWGDAIRVAAVR
jgi:hypothetical protein